MRTYNTKKVFFLAYALYVISKVLNRIPSYTLSENIQKALSFLALMILAFNVTLRLKNLKISKKKILAVIVLLTITGLSLISRDFFLLFVILFGINAATMQDDDVIKLFKISFFTIGITTIGIVLLCTFGLIENVSTARSLGGEARYAWGFVHSQIIPLMFFYLIGDRITYQKNASFFGMLITLFIAFVLDGWFDSRNGLYSMIMLVFLVLAWRLEFFINRKYRKKLALGNLYQNLSKYLAGSISLLSLGLLYLYRQGVGIAIIIDRLLSSRLRAANTRFTSLPMQFIRIVSYAEYHETSVSVLDNGYLYIIARYGILYLILFVILTYYIAQFFQRTRNIHGTIFFISALVSCYITNEIVSCNFLPFMVIGIREILIFINKRIQVTSLIADRREL